MRKSKPYSPAAVKKRELLPKDPYLRKTPNPDGAVCAECGAVYKSKRWALPGKGASVSLKARASIPAVVTCPACQKARDKYPGGVVTLRGHFLDGHRDEILNLVRNEEARARGYNPLERIIEIKSRAGGIEVTTTTEKLAQRIGREVKKAYGGTLGYTWSHDVKFARVGWEREKEGRESR